MLAKSNLEILNPDIFPEFERKAFEGSNLSIKKYETVLSVAQHWEKNDLKWEKLSDEKIINELSQIKGIGKWTIDMILIFTLNRPNVFSYDDFHIKQIMTKLYGLNPKSKLKAQMKEISKPWSPFKSTAFQYLLEWKKFNKSKK
ncbi:MAG: DNA-3-methyladenine glycosylase [Saprospiraceae bacterium]